jgi:hypothetical protein
MAMSPLWANVEVITPLAGALTFPVNVSGELHLVGGE